MLVGFIAAVLRRFMFDNKKPTWSYGIFITVVCEVLHMLMIFLQSAASLADRRESAGWDSFLTGRGTLQVRGRESTVEPAVYLRLKGIKAA